MTVLLSRMGFQVDYLGSDTPLDDLRRYVDTVAPDAVVVSTTTRGPVEHLPSGAFQGFSVPVLIGGFGARESLERVDKAGARYVGEDLESVADMVHEALAVSGS